MQLSLYSIADHYREAFYHLTNVLDDEANVDLATKEQIIEDSLSGLMDDFKTKALNVAGFINNLKLELDAVKTAENRMNKRRNGLENKIQYLSDYLFTQCLKTGSTLIKSDELIIAIKNNPPKVIVDNETAIPEAYKEVVKTIKIAKSAIALAIKNGLDVAGVHLESSKRLDIR